VKYGKSEIEMRLIRDACVIADAMLQAMLAVLHPGRLKTEVAAWGAWVGRMLGSERDGSQIMVGANTANRTLIGPALNRPINQGDWVHLAVAPKRDGLTARIRRSVIATDSPQRITREQKFCFNLVEEAYGVGSVLTEKSPVDNCPLGCRNKLWSTSLGTDRMRSPKVSAARSILRLRNLTRGRTTPDIPSARSSWAPSPSTAMIRWAIALSRCWMLRCAGVGDRWNDVVIPGFDFCVVENTLETGLINPGD
jgi:hypothetical protein